MAAAARQGRPHGMLSIIGLDDAKLKDICEKARSKGKASDTVCQLANYLFPSGRVVSGHKDALAEVQALATAAGAIKCAPLAVSGAFHTPLMHPARDNLVKVGCLPFCAAVPPRGHPKPKPKLLEGRSLSGSSCPTRVSSFPQVLPG